MIPPLGSLPPAVGKANLRFGAARLGLSDGIHLLDFEAPSLGCEFPLGSVATGSRGGLSLGATVTTSGDERDVAQALLTRTQEFNIIIHPDAISNFEYWRPFGSRLCVKNMDKRKPRGRNCRELDAVFEELPEASFCLDIGHSRQVDPTMAETREMLRRFGTKLRQVHLCEVTSSCQHEKLSLAAILAFRSVAASLPERIPIILESVMGNPPSLQEMTEELERAQRALPLTAAGSREWPSSGLAALTHA